MWLLGPLAPFPPMTAILQLSGAKRMSRKMPGGGHPHRSTDPADHGRTRRDRATASIEDICARKSLVAVTWKRLARKSALPQKRPTCCANEMTRSQQATFRFG